MHFPEPPKLLVSSPLTRAIQTAAIGFGGEKCQKPLPLQILNLVSEKVDGWSDMPRDLPSVLRDLPEVCMAFRSIEKCRSNCCQNPETEIIEENIGDDGSFRGKRPYESIESVCQRVSMFWEWLAQRTETRIIVVTHCKFLGMNSEYGLFPGISKFQNTECMLASFS